MLCEGLSRPGLVCLVNLQRNVFQVAAYDESLKVHTGHLTENFPVLRTLGIEQGWPLKLATNGGMKPYHTRLTLITLTKFMFTRAASQFIGHLQLHLSNMLNSLTLSMLSAKSSSVLPNGPPALLGYGSFVRHQCDIPAVI